MEIKNILGMVNQKILRIFFLLLRIWQICGKKKTVVQTISFIKHNFVES